MVVKWLPSRTTVVRVKQLEKVTGKSATWLSVMSKNVNFLRRPETIKYVHSVYTRTVRICTHDRKSSEALFTNFRAH